MANRNRSLENAIIKNNTNSSPDIAGQFSSDGKADPVRPNFAGRLADNFGNVVGAQGNTDAQVREQTAPRTRSTNREGDK